MGLNYRFDGIRRTKDGTNNQVTGLFWVRVGYDEGQPADSAMLISDS